MPRWRIRIRETYRTASWRCLGTILRFLLSRAAFPASSRISAARYSRTAARYTGAPEPMRYIRRVTVSISNHILQKKKTRATNLRKMTLPKMPMDTTDGELQACPRRAGRRGFLRFDGGFPAGFGAWFSCWLVIANRISSKDEEELADSRKGVWDRVRDVPLQVRENKFAWGLTVVIVIVVGEEYATGLRNGPANYIRNLELPRRRVCILDECDKMNTWLMCPTKTKRKLCNSSLSLSLNDTLNFFYITKELSLP